MTNPTIEVVTTPQEQLTVVCCGWCGMIEGMASCTEQCLEASTEAREPMPHQFATTRSIPKPALLAALLKDAGAVKVEVRQSPSGTAIRECAPPLFYPRGSAWLLTIPEDREAKMQRLGITEQDIAETMPPTLQGGIPVWPYYREDTP